MHKVTTTRFGEVEYTDADTIHFPDGILGFPNCPTFLVIQHKEGSPFRWLQCVEEPSLAFLVTDPGNYLVDYAPDVREDQLASIEMNADTARLVLTIVTIPKGNPDGMTINLAGPIVVNLENRKAKQLVLDHPGYSIKYAPYQQQSQPEEVAA